MRTKIVSAFPGMGKTTYHKNNPKTTLDSDSSGFSWVINESGEKVRNSEFPQNYINHIKENIPNEKFDISLKVSFDNIQEDLNKLDNENKELKDPIDIPKDAQKEQSIEEDLKKATDDLSKNKKDAANPNRKVLLKK